MSTKTACRMNRPFMMLSLLSVLLGFSVSVAHARLDKNEIERRAAEAYQNMETVIAPPPDLMYTINWQRGQRPFNWPDLQGRAVFIMYITPNLGNSERWYKLAMVDLEKLLAHPGYVRIAIIDSSDGTVRDGIETMIKLGMDTSKWIVLQDNSNLTGLMLLGPDPRDWLSTLINARGEFKLSGRQLHLIRNKEDPTKVRIKWQNASQIKEAINTTYPFWDVLNKTSEHLPEDIVSAVQLAQWSEAIKKLQRAERHPDYGDHAKALLEALEKHAEQLLVEALALTKFNDVNTRFTGYRYLQAISENFKSMDAGRMARSMLRDVGRMDGMKSSEAAEKAYAKAMMMIANFRANQQKNQIDYIEELLGELGNALPQTYHGEIAGHTARNYATHKAAIEANRKQREEARRKAAEEAKRN